MSGVVDKLKTTNALSLFDQFAKQVLGLTAGFITSQLVEGAYNKYVIERRTTTDLTIVPE